jgi:hypothetical protein
MNRKSSATAVLAVIVFLSLALVACGPQATQPAPQASIQPAPQSTEAPRSTQVPPTQAQQPSPTQPQQPVPTEAAGTTPGALDVNNQAAALEKLGGYHYEGVLKYEETGKTSSYVRVLEDVDAAGNFHIVAYQQEGGQPSLDLYYIDQHLYMGQQGTYMDMGVQSSDQVSMLASAYQMPFQLIYLGMTQPQPVGSEAVNGVPATKYSANFDQWASAYIQAQTGTSYKAEGFVWVSAEGAILKSDVQVSWSKGTDQGLLETHAEVSQAGQVAPLTPPK